ncbi:Gfo/Idh/MocA family oxidoreductase [Deinococcus rubellus]|uniref:Gfo/Idh/MocA family oxidoreductase n=1 Tax=Deinococcus rubellus TaxID=1889240 RepID=A0ABY5YIE0_9DEIO|nr:Gfo/Idh/MocA family oxidoreductase [Deinococcus rubellus]UWX64117.1 Gfo/Idh/MocA family oxidoreductase [Deinococcus rubellus]
MTSANGSEFRIALVGCGSMANTWVDYALQRDDAEIVALVDLNEATALTLAEKHHLGGVPIFKDVAEAIQATGANLVFDVTIPEAHEAVTLAALQAGCNVLGEKPLAAGMDPARRMVAVAGQTGHTYAVMQNRRYLPQIHAFRDLVRGHIGTPGFTTANFFIGAHFGGFRDAMASPLLLDMAIHTFDQARFILGADPVSVYCQEFNPPGSWYTGAAAAACIFEFAGGQIFTYNGSWCAEGAPTSWEAEWRVMGSAGTAIWDGTHAPHAEVVTDPQQEGFLRDFRRVEAGASFNNPGPEGHFGCLDEMFAALSEKRPPETDCADNIKSLSMVFGAVESARRGEKVLLGEPTQEGVSR